MWDAASLGGRPSNVAQYQDKLLLAGNEANLCIHFGAVSMAAERCAANQLLNEFAQSPGSWPLRSTGLQGRACEKMLAQEYICQPWAYNDQHVPCQCCQLSSEAGKAGLWSCKHLGQLLNSSREGCGLRVPNFSVMQCYIGLGCSST